MIPGILAALSFKMVFYTVVLVAMGARLHYWSRRSTEAEAARDAIQKELEMTQGTLLEVGKQATIWQAKANATAIKVIAAQQEAASIRTEYEAKAADAMLAPVTNPLDYLRKEAQK